ncbi:translation elongation factor 1-alpha [Striga asiatica]|uniref:Translation elongation factor 1-alpha n=1 Tax=Striga asiatica TaxID=4170 RepID=A0A5A7RKK9_STRAF|nr:translation elongation factor 1-alpha [Striga asiatica]
MVAFYYSNEKGQQNFARNQNHLSKTSSLGALLGSSLGDLGTRGILLLDTFDDTNSNSLPHVTNSKTAKRRVLGKGLDHHRLCGNHLHKPSISILQELGLLLELLTRSPVNLGHELSKLDSNVGSVAVEHRHITTLEILHSNILHIEPNIVTWESFLHSLMMHLDRFNFSGQTRWAESHHHSRLQYTCLHTTNRHSSNTTNLVHILKRETKGLV